MLVIVTNVIETMETTKDIEVEKEDMFVEPVNVELVKKLQVACALLV